jgi:hypothetical protein
MSLSVGSGSPYIATPPTSDPAKTGGAGSTQKTTGPGKSLTLDNSKGNSGGSSGPRLGQGAPQIDEPLIDLSNVDWSKLASTLLTVGEFSFASFGFISSLISEATTSPDLKKLASFVDNFYQNRETYEGKPVQLLELEKAGISRSFIEAQGYKIYYTGGLGEFVVWGDIKRTADTYDKKDVLAPLEASIDGLVKTLKTLFPDSVFVKDLTANLATLKSIFTEAITSYLTTGTVTLSANSTGKLVAILGMIMQDAFRALGLDTELTKVLQHQPFPGLSASQSQLMTQLLTGSVSLVCIGVAGSISNNSTAAMDAVIKQFGLTTTSGTAEGAFLGILKNFITGSGQLSAEDQKALLALFNPSSTPNISSLATQTAGVFLHLLANFGTTVYADIKNRIETLNQPPTSTDSYEYDLSDAYATA